MVREFCAMPIVICKNKVLYTEEVVGDSSRISLPKGHLKIGENHIQGAIRECQEETGVILTREDFEVELDSYDYKFNNQFNEGKETLKTILPMIFIIDELRETKITEERILVADYMSIDKMIKKATFDHIKDLLKRVKIYLKNR